MAAALKDKLPWSKGKPDDLFELVTCLDEGAFGTVWRGRSKIGGDDVAIKIMTYDEALLPELLSEINFLDQFESNFVIHYHGTWLYETPKSKEIWVVMELAELGSIEGLMLICGHEFTEPELSALFARVILGLEYIHSKGLVHQDIKAKNLLLTIKGQVKLADFGVAASVTNVNQNQGNVSGSPHWMAPEILLGREITQKCDIWSLGITLIELCEGQPPHADIPPINVISIIPERPAPTFKSPGKWSKACRSFLKDTVEKEPSVRKSAEELKAHEFVIKEIVKAKKGDNSILRRLAEACLDEVQEFRNGLEADQEMDDIDEAADLVEAVDDENSLSSSSSDEGNGPMFITSKNKGVGLKTKPVAKKKKTSFSSMVMDEDNIEKPDNDDFDDMVKKLKAKKSRKGTKKERRRTQRSESLVSHAYGVKKATTLRANVNSLNLNMADINKEKENLKKLSGRQMSPQEEKEREETVKKAQALLERLAGLQKGLGKPF